MSFKQVSAVLLAIALLTASASVAQAQRSPAGAAGPNGAPSTAGPATGGQGPTGYGPSPSSPGDDGAGGGHGVLWKAPYRPAVDFCSLPPRLPNPDRYLNPVEGVQAISRVTMRQINQCRCVSQECIAAELDRYAAALAVVVPRLGPELQDLPQIVSQAARRVRAARSKIEAAQVLEEAVATVHKKIELIRVADPDVQAQDARGDVLVAQTLKTAAASLERASEI